MSAATGRYLGGYRAEQWEELCDIAVIHGFELWQFARYVLTAENYRLLEARYQSHPPLSFCAIGASFGMTAAAVNHHIRLALQQLLCRARRYDLSVSGG